LTVVVLMGVAGSGKSTVGALVATRLGWPFQEGDLLHPPANVAKMAAGTPLTDADRAPWLAQVREWIAQHHNGVITCSALKHTYRDALRDDNVLFGYLTAPREVLRDRLRTRSGHFMPPALLDSQLADLEPPSPDERAIGVDIAQPPAVQAAVIVEKLGLDRP
jgi:gluconokinase